MCEETKTERREKEEKKWRAPHEKNKEGLKKVSVMLGHVSGGGKNTSEIMCITDQPQRCKKTCINMLSVGVCESVSVHTLTFLAGRQDISLSHPEI